MGMVSPSVENLQLNTRLYTDVQYMYKISSHYFILCTYLLRFIEDKWQDMTNNHAILFLPTFTF